jgi:hypothetical protein
MLDRRAQLAPMRVLGKPIKRVHEQPPPASHTTCSPLESTATTTSPPPCTPSRACSPSSPSAPAPSPPPSSSRQQACRR